MNTNNITDNKLFWKTVCPLFSEKHISKISEITLLEKNEILTDDAKITKTFNSLFKNVVNTLNIEKDESILVCDAGNETDPVKIAIKTKNKIRPRI